MGDEGIIEIESNIGKRVIRKGKFGKRPSLGWTCDISLRWEKVKKNENLEIIIGNACNLMNRLIERCIQTMQLEEESLFILKLNKDSSVDEVVITLKSFIEKPYIFQWTDGEKALASNFYKKKGTELFKENLTEEAFHKFSTALKLILMLDSVLEKDNPDIDVANLMIALYNNLASCHLHFKNYLSVIKLCSDSLHITPNLKAFYRRALAYIELKEYEKAENDLIELLKLEPKNKAALEKYKLVRELDKTNRENYESIVKKMFQ